MYDVFISLLCMVYKNSILVKQVLRIKELETHVD